MNKIISINIQGALFSIDEKAYASLTLYLEAIRKHLGQGIEADEILRDIEARIAELFQSYISDSQPAILQAEVDRVIAIMGQPEAYELEDGEEQEPTAKYSPKNSASSKQVFRDPDDVVLAGVLSGIAAYWGTNPLWIRLGFAFLVFLGWGSPILLYILLWLIIPKAESTADKLRMRGEPVTIESIRKKKQEESDARVNVASGSGPKPASAFREMIQQLVQLCLIFLKAFSKLFGVFLIFMGLGGLFAAGVSYFVGQGEDGPFGVNNEYSVFGLFPASEQDSMLIQYGGFTALLAFSLLIIFIGLRLITKMWQMRHHASIVWSLCLVLLASAACFTVGAARTALDYRFQEQYIEEPVPLPQSDTLILRASGEEKWFTPLSGHHHYNRIGDIRLSNGTIYASDIRLNITQVDSGAATELKLEKYAQGRNHKIALHRARKIHYGISSDSSGINFDSFLSFPANQRYRGQEVDITLYLPVGKSVYLHPSIKKIIYDIENLSNTYDGKMVGHTWTMTKQGLTCPDFPEKKEYWD